MMSAPSSKNILFLCPPSTHLQSKVFVGQQLQRLGLENTVGHSICPRLSSDEAHFEKCLLWLLLTISTHSVPSETGQRGGSLSVSQVILHLSRLSSCWTMDRALSETLHTYNLMETQHMGEKHIKYQRKSPHWDNAFPFDRSYFVTFQTLKCDFLSAIQIGLIVLINGSFPCWKTMK